VFSTFGKERLDVVDNNTSPTKLTQWKSSEKTRAAYIEIFQNHKILSDIGNAVFKQYKDKELPTTHCAYILAICDILLNPKSSGIKCNDKSVIKRVTCFLVITLITFKFENHLYITDIYFYLINSALLKVKI
jgi:hypothetical protein